MKKVKADSS